MGPARSVTLTDDVYEAVRDLILEHSLAPGERVNIDSLARRLEVSPTPVREALARLESEGLVRKRPLAGYTTTPLLTQAEFEELFDMRLLLESEIAARAAACCGEGDAVSLRAAAQPSGDASFHERLAVLSGHRMLREALERLHAHLHLHRLILPLSSAGEAGVEEHGRIAAAVTANAPDEAAEAMRVHLIAARDRHRRYYDL